MALHGSLMVNGHRIGRWAARRTVDAADGNHTYDWEVWANGRELKGSLQHQYADGALLLAQRVLVAAHAALTEPGGL